jgi:hypothetical protein
MMDAAKGFRRLKAYKYPSDLRATLVTHYANYVATHPVAQRADAA